MPAMATLVGKVNIQHVLVTIKQGKAVRDSLKKDFDSKQKTLKTEEEKIRKMQEGFEKQSLVMNEQAKSKREREIQDKIMQLQQQSMEFQKEIQEKEQTLKKPILERIKEVVDEVSKDAGVDMTFEISTAPIVYAKNHVDLTEKVIAKYDEKHKK